jgi:DNA-binding XRE family transcriptional regulator
VSETERERERARPGWALFVLRTTFGLTAEQVAHAVPISTQRLGALETGAYEPEPELVAHIVTVIADQTRWLVRALDGSR